MSTHKKAPVVSLSGSPIYHHEEAEEWQAPKGEESIEQISAHIQKHLGKVETVFHEIVSDTVHIDVHMVLPTEEQPFARLVTSGMSDLPMKVPEEVDAPRYAELMVTLPGDWKLTQEAFKDENWYWPVRMLKFLARLPHKYNTWLGWGHSVPNDEPYAPNTKLAGAIILPPVSAPEEFQTLSINPEKQIQFFAVIPLYKEEMDFKLRSGTDKLIDRFVDAEIGDVIDPDRPNVARKRFGIF